MKKQIPKTTNPKSFRPTEAEERDIELLKKEGVSRTRSGVMHRALERGFTVLKIERGLIPPIETQRINEEVKA